MNEPVSSFVPSRYTFSSGLILFACCLNLGACKTRILIAVSSLDSVAQCSVSRQDCASGFVFSPGGAINCADPADVNVVIPSLTACFASDVETAASACSRYCMTTATDPNDPHTPDLRLGHLYDRAGELCTATVVGSRPALPGECALIGNVASNGKTAFAECRRGGRPCIVTETSGPTTICRSRAPLTDEDRSTVSIRQQLAPAIFVKAISSRKMGFSSRSRA